jgi:hypothetical protein
MRLTKTPRSFTILCSFTKLPLLGALRELQKRELWLALRPASTLGLLEVLDSCTV